MGDRVGGDVTLGTPLLPVLALSVPLLPPFFVRRTPKTTATIAQIKSITVHKIHQYSCKFDIYFTTSEIRLPKSKTLSTRFKKAVPG